MNLRFEHLSPPLFNGRYPDPNSERTLEEELWETDYDPEEEIEEEEERDEREDHNGYYMDGLDG